MDELTLEEQYAPCRQTIFTILQSTDSYNPQVVKIMIEVFKDYSSLTSHGPILWALMVKGEVNYMHVLSGCQTWGAGSSLQSLSPVLLSLLGVSESTT
jgi:hypothetical protein